MNQGQLHVHEAAFRGAEFLASSQLRIGAINDQLKQPARFLAARRPGRSSVFKAMGGADVWHTVSSMAALARASARGHRVDPSVTRRAAEFVKGQVHPEGGLSYWSITRGLCCETTSFAASILRGMRRSLCSVLRRVALPHGRWPQLLLERDTGYSDYSAAPSVTAWVLSALGDRDRCFAAGLRYLRESLGAREVWDGHVAYYATPLYPAHVASLAWRRTSVLRYVLAAQRPDGGWGFGGRGDGASSVLPTSYALMTLECFEPTPRGRSAVRRARGWLLRQQRADGCFPLGRVPRALWYSGDVYATSMALLALLGRKDDSALCVQ